MRQIIPALCLGLAIAIIGTARAADGPKVVASIKPIHSLVAAVMGDVGTPDLIVKGAGSPHAYSLRPSEATMIDRADIVFWVGPEFEAFLDHPLDAIAGSGRVVRLDGAEGLTLLDLREGGAFEAHEDDDEGSGHGEHAEAADHDKEGEEDDHGDEKNMHVWLDPGNAIAMTRRIVAELGRVAPEHGAAFRANGTALEARIAALDKRLATELAELRDRPFVVFHDAYHYFESRYGLSTVAAFTVNAENAPGARRLTEIRARIKQTGASCVFAEPQFKPEVVTSVAADAGIRSGVLDPLGATVEPGPDAWEEIMTSLARDLRACLGPAS
jgi:zinc transport system substrate-binding protein